MNYNLITTVTLLLTYLHDNRYNIIKIKYMIYFVGRAHQGHLKTESDVMDRGGSFTTCEMTDLLKNCPKTHASKTSCGGSTSILPASLHTSIQPPFSSITEVNYFSFIFVFDRCRQFSKFVHSCQIFMYCLIMLSL